MAKSKTKLGKAITLGDMKAAYEDAVNYSELTKMSITSTPTMSVIGSATPMGTISSGFYDGSYYYGNPVLTTPKEEYKLKPRITKIARFSNGSGSTWYGLDGLPDFISWQEAAPTSRIITSTTPVWNPQSNQLQLIVVYSEEL
jgi:hypothetical protein